MFKKVKPTTVAEYLADVPTERRDLVLFLHGFIKKTAPSLRPHFASNMIGYGSFPYRNHRNEQISWPVVALANQKGYVSIYVCSIVNGAYVAETFKDRLGKVSVGKSCIRVRKIEDINLAALKDVIRAAVKNPGLTRMQ